METEPHFSAKGDWAPQRNLEYAAKEGDFRSKTASRLRYEAECKVIREQMGSLEEVRARLGLSRRKICHLLMVDPSAWTRWMKDDTRVPPHIWRALQWYMALVDKYPVLHPLNGISGSAQLSQQRDLQERIEQAERTIARLKGELSQKIEALAVEDSTPTLSEERQQGIGLGWKLLLLLNTVALLIFGVRALT